MTEPSYEFAPQPPEPPRPPADETPPVEKSALLAEAATERVCPHCGFRTMGKPAKGRCPECSGLMDMATATDLLQFARASWLRMISWSALLIALALVAHLATIAAAVFQPWHNILPGQLAAAGLLAAGMLLVTAHESGGLPQRRWAAAQCARWLTIASALVWIAFWWCTRTHNIAPYRLLMTLLLLLQAAAAVSAGFFLSAVAARIPSDNLATQFQNLAWLVPAALLVALADLYLGLQSQFGYLFYCVFPILGVLAALLLWPAAALLQLALELRNVATASEAIILKRTLRAQVKKTAT